MPDEEIKKVHLEAEIEDRHLFDLTLKGEAENAGVRQVNAADGQTDKKISEERKKDKAFIELLHMQQFEKELNELFDRLGEVLDKAEESLGKIKRLEHLKDNFNMADAQILLMNDHNIDVSGKSEEEVKAIVDDTLGREKLTFESYMEEAKRIDRELKDRMDSPEFQNLGSEAQEQHKSKLLNDYSGRLDSLEKQALADGVTQEKIYLAHEEVRGLSASELIENMVSKGIENVHSQALSNSTGSFAGTLENDPFAETASLTDPFNSVASNMGIKEPVTGLTNEKELEISQAPQITIPSGMG